MSYVNGILTVPVFEATETPGEYNISGATFTNQADTQSLGAYAIQVGFALYVQASDPNTAMQIPGVANRYQVTAVTVIDQNTVDMTVLWNEDGPIENVPTNGVDSILTSVSPSLKYGYPVSQGIYPTLLPGIVEGMMNSATSNITDIKSGVATVNGKQTDVVIEAGDNIVVDASGPTIVISSTGANEGTYQ